MSRLSQKGATSDLSQASLVAKRMRRETLFCKRLTFLVKHNGALWWFQLSFIFYEYKRYLLPLRKNQRSLNGEQYLSFLASQRSADFHSFKQLWNSLANQEGAFWNPLKQYLILRTAIIKQYCYTVGLPKIFKVSILKLQAGYWPKPWRSTKFQVHLRSFYHVCRAPKMTTRGHLYR